MGLVPSFAASELDGSGIWGRRSLDFRRRADGPNFRTFDIFGGETVGDLIVLNLLLGGTLLSDGKGEGSIAGLGSNGWTVEPTLVALLFFETAFF